MIIHFEIPADDIERARTFYAALFGWEIRSVEGRNNFLLISASGEMGLSGSLLKRYSPKQSTVLYFDVTSVGEYSVKVKELGGKIIVPKKTVPGAGYFAICLDTENNTFGLWEENMSAH